MLLALLAIVGNALRQTFAAGDGDATAGVGGTRVGLVDHLLVALPVLHGMQRDRGLADALRTIADAVRTGRSLPRAVDEAARLRVNGVLRERLTRWRDGLEAGMRADGAARQAKLPGLIGGMIASGRGGDPAAAVEFLAAYYGGRLSRTRELIRAATVPALALVFGAVVLFLVVAMYSPLVTMMDSLAAGTCRR